MRNKEKGVGVVEVLLVVVVIGLVVAVGWLFLDRQKNSTASSNDTAPTNSTAASKTEDTKSMLHNDDETAGWLNYASPKGTFSINIPDGWKLNGLSSGETDGLWAWESNAIQYTAGKKATVTDVQGECDGSSIAFALVYGYTDGNNFSIEGSVVKTHKTDNGYDVSKYYFMELGRDGRYLPKGSVSYVYDIKTQSKRAAIRHDVLPGEIDQSSRIEKMINTLTIH